MDLADDLLAFIDASPTPFHVCAEVVRRLTDAGFTQVEPQAVWPKEPGRYVMVNAGTVLAWIEPADVDPSTPFRIVGGHTDSPNLRLKQHVDRPGEPPAIVALEPYGGPLLESWLDRDLGVAGRVVLTGGTERLVRIDEPWLRVPRLAIHLDRESNPLDRQRHLDGIWSLDRGTLLHEIGQREGFAASDVLGFDLMAWDLQPSVRVGLRREFVSAPRLDNLATCFAAVTALMSAPDHQRSLVVLFDHEEVGSGSERGAQSPILDVALERIVLASGGGREEWHQALAGSFLVSGDMAHATHPNYPERHEPLHHIGLGDGPVLKVNQNLRYASDARGSAMFAEACAAAGVPLQRYVHRADLPCGSTIGPISAARTGMLTVDVGAPQLAMHSAREFMAAADVVHYTRALSAIFSERP